MIFSQIQTLVTVQYRKTTFFVICLMYVSGTIGLLIPTSQPYFQLLSSFNLWVSLILLLLFHQDFNRSFIVASVTILLVGFFVEVTGVHKGFIFGKYWYGNTLGTQLFQVPLVIGANWLILVYCSATVTQNIFIFLTKKTPLHFPFCDTLLKAIFASILMVCLDVLIEPVAIQLDFWHWQNEEIPAQNFIAWFLVALVMNYFFFKTKFLKINPLAPLLLLLQFLFFLSINTYHWFF